LAIPLAATIVINVQRTAAYKSVLLARRNLKMPRCADKRPW